MWLWRPLTSSAAITHWGKIHPRILTKCIFFVLLNIIQMFLLSDEFVQFLNILFECSFASRKRKWIWQWTNADPWNIRLDIKLYNIIILWRRNNRAMTIFWLVIRFRRQVLIFLKFIWLRRKRYILLAYNNEIFIHIMAERWLTGFICKWNNFNWLRISRWI